MPIIIHRTSQKFCILAPNYTMKKKLLKLYNGALRSEKNMHRQAFYIRDKNTQWTCRRKYLHWLQQKGQP